MNPHVFSLVNAYVYGAAGMYAGSPEKLAVFAVRFYRAMLAECEKEFSPKDGEAGTPPKPDGSV